MAERKLSTEEKIFIREYISEGVLLGETEIQIKQRRRELAEVLGCTIPQVVGTGAWKQEEHGLILKPLSPVDVIDDLEVPTQERNNELQPQEMLPVSSTTTELQISEPVGTVENNKITIHPKSGAWADYENSEVKDKWRQLEAEFINKHVDAAPEKRAGMKILCTPGIKCYKEVDRLLSLGFKPENITAIERVKGAWSEFETNCRAKGIRPIFGDLKEVLPNTSDKFDIVCLDFLGPFCDSYIEILQQLPLADRAIVAVNVMAKREKKDVQGIMNFIQDVTDRELDNYRLGMRTEAERRVRERGEIHIPGMVDVEVEKMVTFEREASDRHVSEIRDNSLHWVLTRAGTGREDNWLHAERLKSLKPHVIFKQHPDPDSLPSHQIIRKSLDEYAKVFRVALEHLLIRGTTFSTLEPTQHPNITKNAVICTLLGYRYHAELEQYRYRSGVSNSHSPYITNLAVLEKPLPLTRRLRQVVHFGLQFIELLSKHHERLEGLISPHNTDEENKRLVLNERSGPGISWEKNTRIHTTYDKIQITSGKKAVAGISLNELCNSTEFFALNNEITYPLHSSDKNKNFESLGRKLIEIN